MRPHTGRGRVQPQKGELGQPPITCLSRQGRVRLHANRLIFYFGLACKSSRAKPRCNTRSHRLHGLTSLARNKHTQNHHETPPAFSSPGLSEFTSQSLSFISLIDSPISVLTICLQISLLTTQLLTRLSNAFILLRETVVIV